MSTDIDKLLEIKEDIADAKENKAKAEGKLEELMARLKKEFKITSIKAAEAHLEELEKEAKTLKEEISIGVEKLSNELD